MKIPAANHRISELDGLRAIAASLVVMHHFIMNAVEGRLQSMGQEGVGRMVAGFTASGVELFFVLSGAVLLRPYFRQGKPVRVVRYAERRVVRLWPPYFGAWLLAGLAVWLATEYPTWWTRASALPTFAARDWLQQLPIVYLGNNLYNFAWWTLTVECVFYLIAPFLGMIGQRVSFGAVLIVVAMSAAAIVAEYAARVSWSVPVLGAFLQYLACFAWGVILARVDFSRYTLLAICLMGAGLVAASGARLVENGLTGYGFLYAGLVGLAQTGRITSLASPPMVWLGERSYSLFLTHFSVFGLCSHLTSLFTSGKDAGYFLISRLMGLPAAFLVAILLFTFVECRFAHNLETKDQFWPWQAVTP
ncbi:Acyltransferase family protein [Aquisphaera giovannonii]|uniref:Acyltransferase family protein n=1 Tax=Aquisphaera giovannonii TaxID=406548 RepID=A0A5B9WDL2_9BACT|nr:Acyltransferase family protein [Aquisphaera giovannonii]